MVRDLWFAVFGNRHPVEVEIGPGRGEVILAWAAAAPERNFFAIERSSGRATALGMAAARRELPNVRVVAGDAACVLAHGVPDESVAAYHVYFPDPWPKTGHRHRRLFGGDLARQLARTLVPEGTVHVASDLPGLVAAISTQCVAAGLVLDSGAGPPSRPTTAFEQRYAQAGTSYARFLRPRTNSRGSGARL